MERHRTSPKVHPIVRPALAILWAAFVVAALAGTSRGDVARWVFAEWKVRRIVTVDFKPTGYPGEDVGVAAFYTGGLADADGKDFRLCTASGKRLRFRVLQMGPGDFARIAFELVRGTKKYFIYYNNPKAEVVEEANWQPKRGVLLEARHWTGGNAGSAEGVQQAFEKARKPLGGDFIDRVFLGHNPFGPSGMAAVYHFTGFFIAPEAGMYDIATSSDDASFVLIDGKQIVGWGGSHGRTWQARHTAKYVLSDRVHRLDYWLVNFGGQMTAVAAWRRPGAGQRSGYKRIPANVFLPVFRASLNEVDIRGQRTVPDFSAENVGESWFNTFYPVRMKFRNSTKGANPSYGSRSLWEFGDGQASTIWEPEHIYLTPGVYTVKLTIVRGTKRTTIANQVYVSRDWRKQTQRTIDDLKTYAQKVAKYDFRKLDTRNLIVAVNLFQRLSFFKDMIASSRALVFDAKRKDVPDAELFAKSVLLGDTFRKGKQYTDAAAAYSNGESVVKGAASKADLAARFAEVYLNGIKDVDKAEVEFKRGLKSYESASQSTGFRRLLVGLGDAYRRRGDYSGAKDSYSRARKIRVFRRSKEQNAVRIGTLARYVEEYSRTRDFYWAFHFLEVWGWEYPSQRLEGFWSLLRTRALMARGEVKPALREVLDLVVTNPTSPHAVELLLLGADCYIAMNDKAKAMTLLQRIVKHYPEDPRRPHAVDQLRQLSGAPPKPWKATKSGKTTKPVKPVRPIKPGPKSKNKFFGI